MLNWKKWVLNSVVVMALSHATWAADTTTHIQAEPQSFSISLQAGDQANIEADWWLLAFTSSGWYYYQLTGGWASGLTTTLQAALFDFDTVTLSDLNGLPVGDHTLYFAVDTNQNGQVDIEHLFYNAVAMSIASSGNDSTGTYPIVDTHQTHCFSDDAVIACGTSHTGQDGQYEGLQSSYQSNGDGTITDLNTGLMWIQDAGDKTTYTNATTQLENYSFAGYNDWRLPTIKELYSLAQFDGLDPSRVDSSVGDDSLRPFIDTNFFAFQYGDQTGSARVIDAQWLTSSIYGSTVMNGSECFFGFNFADGRIKCYPTQGMNNGYFAQFVRGGNGYGVNHYVNNGNQTISDTATGLTWTQNDNGIGVIWDTALSYCEGLVLAGVDDWRLPNIKELQSIVDYSRSPDITNSPAIDPLFNLTKITNEAGQDDYGFYWSSTTQLSYTVSVQSAYYISMGRALGYMEEFGGWIDVHGAGAQRSDDKESVPPNSELGSGPQGDAVRSSNYALCVRGGVANESSGSDPSSLTFGINIDSIIDLVSTSASVGGEPDLSVAALTLGITEQQLQQALGSPPPDLNAAAQTLGITVAKLQAALGLS